MYITSLHERYIKMSNDFFEAYSISKEEFKSFTGNRDSFDLRELTDDFLKDLEILSVKMRENALSCVLFQALAFESMMNHLGVRVVGASKFKEHYEKLSSLNKLIVLYRIEVGEDFPKGEKLYKDIKNLTSLRNDLAHSKSKNFDYYNSGFEEHQKIHDYCDQNIIDKVEEIQDVCSRLQNKLNSKLKNNWFDEYAQERMYTPGNLAMFYK